MKENGMSFAYSTHGRYEESQEQGRRPLWRLSEDGRMILKWILKQ
jgi:hypothetical protein